MAAGSFLESFPRRPGDTPPAAGIAEGAVPILSLDPVRASLRCIHFQRWHSQQRRHDALPRAMHRACPSSTCLVTAPGYLDTVEDA